MTDEEFQRNFPKGVVIPEYLQALLAFQNEAREWYSGHFELDRSDFGDPAWFDGDRSTSEQFVVFGHGPDGSVYALWLYQGRSIDDAPVVFLGSEGTDCGLVADNLKQFLSLLAIGAFELGFEISWGEVSEARDPARRLDEFRHWLNSRFGITPADDPIALVRSAQQNHPDFGFWLKTWQASRA